MRLKSLRQEKGFTQTRMAMELHASQSTISALEMGERQPDTELLLRLAAYFQVSTDYLLGLSDIRRPLDPQSLTAEEQSLVGCYRQLSSTGRNKLLAYAQGLTDQ